MLTQLIEQNRREAEDKAKADYQRALGTIVIVKMISGYDENGESVDRDGLEISVRVLPIGNAQDLTHWIDEYLDPYWNVEPIDKVPELTGLRSFWTFGPSYMVTAHGVTAVE
jgi:hypothetical protein